MVCFAVRSRPGVFFGFANNQGPFPKTSVLFNVTAGGSLTRLQTTTNDVFGTQVVQESDTICGVGAHSIFSCETAQSCTELARINIESVSGTLDPESFRPSFVRTTEGIFWISGRSGGNNGGLSRFMPGEGLVEIRKYSTDKPLAGELQDFTLGRDGSLFAIMQPSFLYSPDGSMVNLPQGAICRIGMNGEVEVLIPLTNLAPASALTWHDNALYFLMNQSLYRFDMRTGRPSVGQ